MSNEWNAGILSASSWHGLETVGTIADAADMVRRAYALDAWPVEIEAAALLAISLRSGDVPVPEHSAIVGHYQSGAAAVLGVNGSRYEPAVPDQWRQLCEAACDAGGRPSGAFSLRGGRTSVATFEVGSDDEISSHLVLSDTYDGSAALSAGATSIRVVCANTLEAARSASGADWAVVRHTATLPHRVEVLAAAIGEAIRAGESTRETYQAARARPMSRADATDFLELLYPIPEIGQGVSARSVTIATLLRDDAVRAMARTENAAGATLATAWNAATWSVDRRADGTARPTRADPLGSMLSGSRGARVAEIRRLVNVILADGSTVAVEAADPLAIEAAASVGRATYAELFS